MKFRYIAIVIFLTFFLSGCKRIHPDDPFEPYNRVMYKINKGIDNVAIKPFAYIYNGALPRPVRLMIGNFFQNFREIPNVINDVLQANRQAFYRDLARLTINTTLGIGGLFDVAATAGLKPHTIDFGMTLAIWGNRRSNYLVLPILGPSTIRDTIGLVVTYYMSPWAYIDRIKWKRHGHNDRHRAKCLRNWLLVAYFIDMRASLLEHEKLIETAAIDEYAFIRDAYLQNREYRIFGGCANGSPDPGNENLNEDLPEPPE